MEGFRCECPGSVGHYDVRLPVTSSYTRLVSRSMRSSVNSLRAFSRPIAHGQGVLVNVKNQALLSGVSKWVFATAMPLLLPFFRRL